MKQININVTPEFERDLRRLMEIRSAFADLLGAGLRAPLNPKAKFNNEAELWVKTPLRPSTSILKSRSYLPNFGVKLIPPKA